MPVNARLIGNAPYHKPEKYAGTISWVCKTRPKEQHVSCTKLDCPCECHIKIHKPKNGAK